MVARGGASLVSEPPRRDDERCTDRKGRLQEGLRLEKVTREVPAVEGRRRRAKADTMTMPGAIVQSRTGKVRKTISVPASGFNPIIIRCSIAKCTGSKIERSNECLG
jgi:hypothetical protein